jgi:hypothetical protein
MHKDEHLLTPFKDEVSIVKLKYKSPRSQQIPAERIMVRDP